MAKPGHDAFRLTDLRLLRETFAAGTFDAVIALDVIEHLDKRAGFSLLDAMESIARACVVVMTPNGFVHQSAEPHNPYQEHLSGWTVRDFLNRGYIVRGIRGWKPLRKEYARPSIKPARLGWRLSAMTQPLVTNHPSLAYQLFATKRFERTR
jgi:hypothetical protein